MNHQQLRYVVAVAREKHFGRAAESCYVSQPTLSLGLKKLEEELGVELFIRGPGGVTPTPLGYKVVEKAMRIIQEVDALRALVHEPVHPLMGALRVGVVDTVAPYVMPLTLSYIDQLAPNVDLRIETGVAEDLSKKLARGMLDCVVVCAPGSLPETESRHLYDEPLKVVVPAGHAFGKTGVTVEALYRERVLLLERGRGFTEQLLAFLPGLADAADSVYRCRQTFEGILHMVLAGMGVTVLPCTVACSELFSRSRLTTVAFSDIEPYRRVVLTCRSDSLAPELLEVMAQAILTAVTSSSGCAHVVPAGRPELSGEAPHACAH
jgi:LysR family hydrogen peroxide-inducible transcriptional activator